MDHRLCLVLGSGCVDLGPYEAVAARRMSLVSKSVLVRLLRHGPLWLVERLQRAPTTPVARPPTWEGCALADELRLQDMLAVGPCERARRHRSLGHGLRDSSLQTEPLPTGRRASFVTSVHMAEEVPSCVVQCSKCRARVLWLVRVMLLLTSKSMFRRDAVAGHAAVPRGMCALGQRASDKMYCH